MEIYKDLCIKNYEEFNDLNSDIEIMNSDSIEDKISGELGNPIVDPESCIQNNFKFAFVLLAREESDITPEKIDKMMVLI